MRLIYLQIIFFVILFSVVSCTTQDLGEKTSGITIVTPAKVIRYKMDTEDSIQLTFQKRDTTHKNIAYYNGIYYYAKNNHVYCMKENIHSSSHEKKEKWYRYIDLDTNISYLWKNKNGVYMCDANFNKYQINNEIDSVKSHKSKVENFNAKIISKMLIRKGVLGCEGAFTHILSYELNNEVYVKMNEEKFDDDKNDMPRYVSKDYVEELKQCIYSIMCGEEDTPRLILSKKFFSRYKDSLDEDIAILERNDLTGFDTIHRYDYLYDLANLNQINLKDLRTLSTCLDTFNFTQQMQNLIFSKPNNEKSTYDFCTLCLVFDDGNYLMLIGNESVSIQPSFLRCPWTALYNGEPFLLKSLSVGFCIDKMTQGKLLSECNTKEHALKTILKYLLENSNISGW